MFDPISLAALAAVVRTGSFERAAASLNVSPSAVSQRVRQLEERFGAALVVRGQPCKATPAGQRVCQHADDVALLERGLKQELSLAWDNGGLPRVRIAINADSLATWFVDAIAQCADHIFDLVVDDEGHCAQWLARGEVVAAISAREQAPPGCTSQFLGEQRYIAVASPAFCKRYFADGIDECSLAIAPCAAFDHRDLLQERWMQHVTGCAPVPPTHCLPSTEAFYSAAVAGIAWCMNPESLIREALARGELIELKADTPVDVPLYWQSTRLMQQSLCDVQKAVVAAASRHLYSKTD